jgi:hypothetical protein
MKYITALFTVLALGVLIVSHSPVDAQQASVMTTIAQTTTHWSAVRLPLQSVANRQTYTEINRDIIKISGQCRKEGSPCKRHEVCCSGACGGEGYPEGGDRGYSCK